MCVKFFMQTFRLNSYCRRFSYTSLPDTIKPFDLYAKINMFDFPLSCFIINVFVNTHTFSFKHNTSFVSRFSTIRRHKPQASQHAAHSPITRNRFAGASQQSSTTVGDDGTRIPPSVSEDSVTKEVSDASKRNSDGMYT